MTNKNYNQVYDMIEFARDIGADGISFKPIDFSTKDEGIKHLLLSEEQATELKNNLRGGLILLKKIKLNNVIASSSMFLNGDVMDGIYTEHIYEKIGCYAPWYFGRIFVNKRFSPCCHMPSLVSLDSKNNFEKIWFSSKYKKFREKLRKMRMGDKIMKKCKVCSQDDFILNLKIEKKLKELNLLQFLK
jgi:MoaA/NifB/PqqE/SkfB family radical SAM enzyme